MLLLFLPAIPYGFSQTEQYCRVCGKRVDGQESFYTVKETQEVICKRCSETAPRCRFCKLPTAPSQIDPETGACPQCSAQLVRCRVCGKVILGVRYHFHFREGYFCPACKKNRPACQICGAPVGRDLWRYPDGRLVCGTCGERAIFDIEEISRIMQESQTIAEGFLGLVLRLPYVLKVEKLNGTSATALALRERIFSDGSPLYGKELGLYRRIGNSSEIFLLFGLIPELVYEAAAHEYAHAWQADNDLSDLDPEWVEGFAQWVAAEVLRHKGFSQALERLEQRDDYPYGTGYRRLKKAYRGSLRSLLPH